MAKDYSELSKEELLKLIEKQEEELTAKKYGLVWDAEREPEQVVLDCENNLPVLKRVKGKEIRANNEEDNILIEGDNYHALTVLNYTHKEKIDVIYIDPPYNTGNNDFVYNDKYVDREDGFRHSKWLNFMEKRLNLAKELLKETGVIFISIDDNEQAQCKLLCDRIFGEENFLANLVWANKEGGGSSDSKNFRIKHEYIVVYSKLIGSTLIKGVEISNRERYTQSDEYNLIRGPYYLQKLGMGTIQYSQSLDYPITAPDNTKIFPKDNNNGKKACWRWSQKKLIWGLKEKFIEFKKDKKGVWQVYTKQYLNCDNEGTVIERRQRPFGVIDQYSSTQAAKTLQELFDLTVFNYSKPVELIKYLLSIVSNDHDIILDFMAGSGTTGHAVLELNKEDGGNRKFILCTNNELNGLAKELREKGMSEKEIEEHGICRRVTYPRLEKVINGYKNPKGEKVAGLGGNLQYFRTDLIKKTKNKDQVRLGLTGKCTEMLCVKENIFNLEIESDNYKIFSSHKKDKFLCVYYNFIAEAIPEFVKAIKKIKGQKVIYMFSVDNEVDNSLFAGVSDFTVEAIPEKILEEYRRLNKMNIPVSKELIYFDFNKAEKIIFEQGEKNNGAMLLRIVLERIIRKIAQANKLNILKADGKEEKAAILNDKLKSDEVFSKVEWEENKTYLAIGNHAAHGEYGEYELEQVKNFHKHVRLLLNKFNI